MQPTVVQEITRARGELTDEQFGKYLSGMFRPHYDEMKTRDLKDTIQCAKLAGISPLEIFTTIVSAR